MECIDTGDLYITLPNYTQPSSTPPSCTRPCSSDMTSELIIKKYIFAIQMSIIPQCTGFFLPGNSFGLQVLSLPTSVCPCVYKSLACLHDNSSSGQARITKCGVQVQKTLVKVPIVSGGRLWLLRSNLTWKSNFTSFCARPHENLSSVQSRVTEFWPKMDPTVKIPIDLEYDRPWSSGSNLT